MATSIYANMTPYPRHFYVVFDVASCLLNPSSIVKMVEQWWSKSEEQDEGRWEYRWRAWRYNICMTSVKAPSGKLGQLLILTFSKEQERIMWTLY